MAIPSNIATVATQLTFVKYIIPGPRQELRVSLGRVGDEGGLVLDQAIRVAVAEFSGAKCVQCLGVGGELGGAECLDILGLFVRYQRMLCLQFGELPVFAGVVGKLVAGEYRPREPGQIACQILRRCLQPRPLQCAVRMVK